MTVIMLFLIFDRGHWMQRSYANVGLSRQHLNAPRLRWWGSQKWQKKKISLVWFYMMMLLLRWRCGTKFDYKTNYLNSVRTFPKMVQSDCPQHWGRRKRRQEEEERGGVQGEPDDAVSERRSSSSSAPSSSPSSHVPGRRRENGIGTRHVLLERNRCVVSIK